jgi:CheY-like chemotaxis protein
MAAAVVSQPSLEHSDVTRWALVVTDNMDVRRRTCRTLWYAGFAVEVVLDAAQALGCLAVIKPALLVVDDDLPGSGDLLDRARAIGVESARHSDMVGEELAHHRERNRGDLFG